MAPITQDDKGALGRLVTALRAILEFLDRWQVVEPAGEAPAGLAEYDLDEVASAFEKIAAELEKSGPGGEVYQHFRAIADQLRVAADGLYEE
jgi:hypothetical protein